MKSLWLTTELLHPVNKGGRIRTYNMLRELKQFNHITYFALDDGTADADARERATEYCHELVCLNHPTPEKFTPLFYADLARNLASRLPYAVQKYVSAELRRLTAEWVAREKPDVLICDFLAASINLPQHVNCPTVLFQHNVEAVIWQRHYEVQTQPFKRAYLQAQWRRMHAFERNTCQRFDQVVAVSVEDCNRMRRDYGVENVADIPTGVDTKFFRPSCKVERDPYNLVFTGSMDWLPNEDGIQYFVDKVLPLVRRVIPQVTLTVVGRQPFQSLVELSRRDPSIIVTGRVDDVRPYIEKAAAYLVPLRIGGGTRIKIYEAMAMEKPVISTTIGAEGLPVRHGEDLILADTAEDFADSIIRVLRDESYAHKLGAHAARTVRENFGWDKVAERFAEICAQACAKSRYTTPAVARA
ncbi:MAG TPA: glycosyltransferase [Blastocatellia bacterium]|nr:glycosyltransferase [Blastocatellia bacterium]